MNPDPSPSIQEREEMHRQFKDTVLFYWILTIVAVGIYITTLIADPSLQKLPLLAIFTLLFIIHIALHWLSSLLALRPRWVYPYFVLQILILTILVVMASGQLVIIGLYMALIGLAVGMMESIRRSALVAGAMLILVMGTFGWFNGWSDLLSILTALIGMTLFVVIYVTLFTRQGRSRAEAERLLHELETAHQQLAEYAARVEDLTLSAERQRMARELHDTLAQGLAGLILQLEAADSNLSQGKADKSQEIVQQAMVRARATLSDARGAIGDLRAAPPSPAELGNAIRQEAARFTSATTIPCRLDLDLMPSSINSKQAEHAIRMVSEGLANVARHARASQVSIRLAETEDGLAIEVRDNGVGFEPDEIEQRGGHYGLIGLRERARLAGGTIEIHSTPTQGTNLIMLLPIRTEEGDS